MRLIMMGTGPFAVPTFLELYKGGHDVAALVTAPVRSHRGKEVAPASPMRLIAREHGTPAFDPEDVNTPEAQRQLAAWQADLLVVCDYGQILAAETLAAARLGGINLHASLLPKYRGAAPINWAIYHGETETGVTLIHMTPKLDAGPCIAQAATPIDPDETAAALEVRLAVLGAGQVRQAIDALARGEAKPLSQDPALASKAPRLKKTDGAIDWSRPAAAIKNQIRALEPWPKTYTFWRRRDGAPMRLILGPVDVYSPSDETTRFVVPALAGSEQGSAPRDPLKRARQNQPPPGTVVEAAGSRLVIAAGVGAVLPRSIQPAGKRLMPIDEFLRGHRVEPGDRFGPE